MNFLILVTTWKIPKTDISLTEKQKNKKTVIFLTVISLTVSIKWAKFVKLTLILANLIKYFLNDLIYKLLKYLCFFNNYLKLPANSWILFIVKVLDNSYFNVFV